MEIVTEERTYEGLPAIPAVVMATLETTGIRQLIDDCCKGIDVSEHKLSPGMAVKAMVGAMVERGKRPLYMLGDYYSTAPVDKLFGSKVGHESLSDTVLAERLDTLFRLDTRKVLTDSYLLLRDHYDLKTEYMFLDHSNYTMFGMKYVETELRYETRMEERGIEIEPSPMPCYGGNAKDGRNDLVQMNISHVVDQNGIPICAKSYSGNTSDVVMNDDMVEYLTRTFDMKSMILMADCKLCVEDMLNTLMEAKVPFVTKVPLNFNNKLKETMVYSAMDSTLDESPSRPGRLYYETTDKVCGKDVRVIAYILPGSLTDSERFIRGHGLESAKKRLRSLKSRRFFCEKDAMDAFEQTMSGLDADCYAADPEIV